MLKLQVQEPASARPGMPFQHHTVAQMVNSRSECCQVCYHLCLPEKLLLDLKF